MSISLATLGIVMSACAQFPAQIPGGSNAPGQSPDHTPAETASSSAVVETLVEPDRFRIRRLETGEVVMDTPRANLFFEAVRHRDALNPSVDIRELPNGFDAEFTFVNDTGEPMPLGSLALQNLRLGREFVWRDFSIGGAPERVEGRGRSVREHFRYADGEPGHYSPVMVLETDDLAIGINLLYPVLEYQHGVRGRLWGRDDGGWNLRIRLSDLGFEGEHSRLENEAILPPGQSRSYTLAVRFTEDKDRWIETLEPYRAYFERLYGGVAYERDPRPVRGITLAGQGPQSARNPYGFRQEDVRPDVEGFGPLLEWVGQTFSMGDRVMFWQPTGLYLHNQEANFPFKFTSFWMEGDRYGHAMADAPQQFRRFKARQNVDLGFWWGRSTSVTRRWDIGQSEFLDPDNPEHVRLAFDELELARAAGADFIGLDAFGSGGIPLWDLVRWVEMMREEFPTLKFITERHQPDLLHRLGPTFFMAYNKKVLRPRTVEEIRYVTTPHYLADYLLPGHETWLALRNDILENVRNFRNTSRFRQAEFERAMQMGYVPVYYDHVEFGPGDVAAESWRRTVPGAASGGTAPAPPSAPAPSEASDHLTATVPDSPRVNTYRGAKRPADAADGKRR